MAIWRVTWKLSRQEWLPSSKLCQRNLLRGLSLAQVSRKEPSGIRNASQLQLKTFYKLKKVAVALWVSTGNQRQEIRLFWRKWLPIRVIYKSLRLEHVWSVSILRPFQRLLRVHALSSLSNCSSPMCVCQMNLSPRLLTSSGVRTWKSCTWRTDARISDFLINQSSPMTLSRSKMPLWVNLSRR